MKCVFILNNKLQHILRLNRCKRPSKLAMQYECTLYGHFYLLAIVCTTNSSLVLARERWNYFFPDHSVDSVFLKPILYELQVTYKRNTLLP